MARRSRWCFAWGTVRDDRLVTGEFLLSTTRGVRKTNESTINTETSNETGRTDDDRGRDMPLMCADCGDPVQLPFKPRRNRLVYCKPCHRARTAVVQPQSSKMVRGAAARRGQPRENSSQRLATDDGPPPPPPPPRLGFGRAGSYE